MFMLVPGLFFWAIWISSNTKKEDYALLVPANILTLLSLSFFTNIFIASVLGVQTIWEFTSFMYPGSVALAFWISWLGSGRKDDGLKSVAIIMTIIYIFLFIFGLPAYILEETFGLSFGDLFWPVILILIGLVIIFDPFKNTNKIGGKSEDEWEEWGTELGKKMEKIGSDIGKGLTKMFEGEEVKANKAKDKS